MISLTDLLVRYPAEMGLGTEPPAEVFDRYHAPGFVLHNDGVRLDRERLLDHARPARRRVTAVTVEVHQAFTVGDEVAARYTMTATMRAGTVIATEIYALGRVDGSGRLTRLDQVTRRLPEPAPAAG